MTEAARVALAEAAREWLERNPPTRRAPRSASLVESLASLVLPRRAS
jgi:hypothetical protein